MNPASTNPNRVLSMVLAGGTGKRLLPLTLDRAKPAVPFGSHYRLIDSRCRTWRTAVFARSWCSPSTKATAWIAISRRPGGSAPCSASM